MKTVIIQINRNFVHSIQDESDSWRTTIFLNILEMTSFSMRVRDVVHRIDGSLWARLEVEQEYILTRWVPGKHYRTLALMLMSVLKNFHQNRIN